MTPNYTWTITAIAVCDCPDTGLTDVVQKYEVRVRAEDGETTGHSDWYAGVNLGAPDPETFIAFPTDPADTPAFEAQLKAWALDHLDKTEEQIEAAALAQLEAYKARPTIKALP